MQRFGWGFYGFRLRVLAGKGLVLGEPRGDEGAKTWLMQRNYTRGPRLKTCKARVFLGWQFSSGFRNSEIQDLNTRCSRTLQAGGLALPQ